MSPSPRTEGIGFTDGLVILICLSLASTADRIQRYREKEGRLLPSEGAEDPASSERFTGIAVNEITFLARAREVTWPGAWGQMAQANPRR